MDKQTQDVVLAPENRAVAALLMQHLPRMQKSALKHAYLTSVANVLMNPVKTGNAPDGTRHIIGFGDRNRRLPLYVICEDNGSVRHAFVPNPNGSKAHPYERKMLELLQQHEHEWSKERGVRTRDIAQEIRTKGRAYVNQHGLNSIDPRAFTDDDRSIAKGGVWYDTDYLPEAISYDGCDRAEAVEL